MQTVAPILSIGSASLVAISTLTSEINFYTRLIQMIDPGTERPLFAVRCIELCCERCKEDGKQTECVHMLHLVPMWQSEDRHRKLKIMMQDRPDLIQSELAGLAFDSLQQVFRKTDIAIAMSLTPLECTETPTVFVVIDPAAGGPQSDYAVVSIIRFRGSITVSVPHAADHASEHCVTNVCAVLLSTDRKSGIMCLRIFILKLPILRLCCSVSLCIIEFLSSVSTLNRMKNNASKSVCEILCSQSRECMCSMVELCNGIQYCLHTRARLSLQYVRMCSLFILIKIRVMSNGT